VWLFEGRLSVYLVLIAVAFVLLLVWWQTRERRWQTAVLIVLALIGCYFLLDRAVETEREQVVRKVRAMADGVRERDVSKIFIHISERFHFAGADRVRFRQRAEQAIGRHEVDEVEVWEFQFPDDFRTRVQVPGQGEVDAIRVSFMAKPKGGVMGDQFFRCEAVFVREPDEQWRLFEFQLFNPAVDSNQPVQIPGV
jgi:hypothetical protein